MSRPTHTIIAGGTGEGGCFRRQDSAFREWVTERPAPGRLHLYVSLACPWAHRAVIVRALQGLEEVLPMTVLDPLRDERGWRFLPDAPDPVNGFAFLAEAYRQTDPAYAARVTVPVLYDTEERRIINNESSEIIQMLAGWRDGGPARPDLDPPALRDEIAAVNDRVYTGLNNAVYEAGFATTQAAYEEAFDRVFATLDWLEAHLATRRFLAGDALTLADVRLFTTLIRFDAVYVQHFKCNLRRIADLPNLTRHLKDVLHTPGVAATVDLGHIKAHYFRTHPQINPLGIVPKGPALDLG